MRSIAGVSPALHWLRGLAEEADYLLAAEVKALNWQQEFEADEVACAVMARLRLSSDHMSACGCCFTRVHGVPAAAAHRAAAAKPAAQADAGRPTGLASRF